MKTKGKHLLAEGKVSEARDCFKQCTEITFDMISNLIKVKKKTKYKTKNKLKIE